MSSLSSRGSSAREKRCQADLELRVLGGEINPVFDHDKENIVLQLAPPCSLVFRSDTIAQLWVQHSRQITGDT